MTNRYWKSKSKGKDGFITAPPPKSRQKIKIGE